MVNHNNKTLSDKITVIGNLEHIYYHAKKSAGVVEDEDKKTFYLTMAQMAKDFRRAYMKRHFPECPDELWCLVKATEAARQRVYEADEGDVEDIEGIDAIWANVMEELTGEDLSGCVSCKADKGEEKGCLKMRARIDASNMTKDKVYDVCLEDFGRKGVRVYWVSDDHILSSRTYKTASDFNRVWQPIEGEMPQFLSSEEMIDEFFFGQSKEEESQASEQQSVVARTCAYKAKALFEDEDTKKGVIYTIYTQRLLKGDISVYYHQENGNGKRVYLYANDEDFNSSWGIMKDGD